MSAKLSAFRAHAGRVFAVACMVTAICAAVSLAAAQQSAPMLSDTDWQQKVRDDAKRGQLDDALALIEAQIAQHPGDLEAHGWRGRVLAWKGRWAEAEDEYKTVLLHAPDDVEILCALADVLLWQEKLPAALESIDSARARSPSEPEVLLRRARILRALGRTAEAHADFKKVLDQDPRNSEAKSGLASMRPEYKHELRLGDDIDSFNFADTAQRQSVSVKSAWSRRWSTVVESSFYQRFGEVAQKVTATSWFRLSGSDWIGVGAGGANDHGIVPKCEASFEYGHGLRFHNPWIRGLEASYQQRWLWYAGAHVLTLSFGQTYYLPRDWTWGLTVNGARSGFAQTGVDWVPSGSTRLGFPVIRRLSGHVMFAVGSEDFAQVDQIGRFAAHTFGGGVRFQVAANQDVQGYVARQNRSRGRSQTSYGVSYGIHF